MGLFFGVVLWVKREVLVGDCLFYCVFVDENVVLLCDGLVLCLLMVFGFLFEIVDIDEFNVYVVMCEVLLWSVFDVCFVFYYYVICCCVYVELDGMFGDLLVVYIDVCWKVVVVGCVFYVND